MSRLSRMVWILCLTLSGVITDLTFASKINSSKAIYGFVEHVTLPQRHLQLKAKLDTGAKTASLHAKRIRYVIINDKPYLKFIVPTQSGEVSFTAPYIGEVSIKARSGEIAGVRIKKPAIKRPVVMLPVTLGDKTRDIRVNLANRKRFSYPLLLGREAIMAFDGLVDSSKKYTISTST